MKTQQQQQQQQNYPHPHSSSTFEELIGRHRFVCFFVVQGFRGGGGGDGGGGRRKRRSSSSSSSTCFYYYSAHTLNLRKLIATEYHDVMTTFVIDTGNISSNNGVSGNIYSACSIDDVENGVIDVDVDVDNNNFENNFNDEAENDDEASHFCSGTGFAVYPPPTTTTTTTTTFLSSTTTATTLALLNVAKVPSVVVIDTSTGRVVSRDAILAIEKNDSHTVINRWQSGRSGLSCVQQFCAAMTCESEDVSCCAIQ